MLKELFKKSQKSIKNREFGLDSYIRSEIKPSSSSNYKNNVIVFKCVNLIASTASHIPWKIYKKQSKQLTHIDTHPLSQILKHPNNMQSGADFFVQIISNKLLYGNAFIYAHNNDNSQYKELYIIPNNNIEAIIKSGKLLGYKHIISGKEKIYSVNQLTGMCKILHIKTYNPNNEIYGISPLSAASDSLEIHNMASRWNISLLKNGARPSGALIIRDTNNYLTDEQFTRLQDQFQNKYTGSDKVGNPLLLEGGLDWKDMSISPKDMDFIESKNMAAREIALAFGVPPQLLGIAGDNTYSNMKEARLALWEETIIPLLDKLSDSFSSFFSKLYNEDILVDFDRDEISALTGRREVWSRIESSDFMTINEKRAFVGLPPIKGGDEL